MRFFSLFDKRKAEENGRSALRHPKRFVRLVAAGAILVAIIFLTAPQFQISLVHFKPERKITRTVVAQFPFAVKDLRATQARARAQAAKVGKIYFYDATTAEAVAKDLSKIIQLTDKFLSENENKPPAERADYGKLAAEIRKTVGVRLSSATLRVVANEILMPRFSRAFDSMFRDLYEKHIVVEPTYADDWETRQARIEAPSGQTPPPAMLHPSRTIVYPAQLRSEMRRRLARFYPLALTPRQRPLFEGLFELAMALARPNLTYQPDVTRKRLERVGSSLKPVYRKFRRGEVIIRRGETPTAFQVEVLREYNARIRYYRVLRLGAYSILVIAMVLFLALYIKRFRPTLKFHTSTIVLVGIPLLVVLAVGKAATVLLGETYGAAAGYLFPAGLIGMLCAILLDTQLAIILVVIGSLLVGLATNMSFSHAVPALFGGLAAVTCLHNLRERGQLFRAALYVGLFEILAIGSLRFIEDPTHLYYAAMGWGAANAALCYFLAIGMFPLFESLFGITTDLKLLELTGVPHPLIRELEEKAPGTYQHSLNVAKLAEAAAEKIGANYLLVRAGAYFHDIGKLVKPKYFSENQLSPEERQIHKKLTPYMSCLVIRNHVKEGIELARRYGLPEKVIEFIPQHHGTCLIKYFYHQAIREYEESESAEPVREADFRYPGPKPQSIEAAIVMVADSVEATATSRLNRPKIDRNDVKRLVWETIQDKFSDGQFDECHLTLRQLHDIQESMVNTLVGRFHYRIEYPSQATAAAKKATKETAA